MTTLRDTADIVSDLLTAAIDGGGTVPAIHGQPVPLTGYAVGGRVITQQAYWDHELREALTAFVDTHRSTAAFHRSFFGVWEDGSAIHIDLVDVIHNRLQAIVEGKSRNELAIWDLNNDAEIRL